MNPQMNHRTNPQIRVSSNSSSGEKKYLKHEWKKRLSDEFGMSVRELVELFISDGYSKHMTARILSIDVGTLQRYCNPRGIVFPDRNNLRAECKPKSHIKGRVHNPWGCRGKSGKLINTSKKQLLPGEISKWERGQMLFAENYSY